MLFDYAANLFLNHMFGKTDDIDFGNGVYVGLSTTVPNKDGSNITEPSGNGYERKLVGYPSQALTQLMGNASGGVITNIAPIMFNPATGAWGTCSWFVIFTAQTGGNGIGAGEILNESQVATPIVPIAGSVPTIDAGGLNWQLNQ